MKNSLNAVTTAPAQTVNLNKLSKTQLRKIASDKGLKNYENLLNSQLVELIQTGKFTEAVKVEQPTEPEVLKYKIGSTTFSTRKVISVNFIRSMVKDYALINNLSDEAKKKLTVTLPNGTVLHVSKLSFISVAMRQVDAVQLAIQDAKFGGDITALQQLSDFAKVGKNTNRLPIAWDCLGTKTTEPEIYLPMLKDALQLAVNESQISNISAMQVCEAFQEIADKNNFKFDFKPLQIDAIY